jgi:glycosyltransferase involved in cell wall biosynthesis
MATNVLEKTAAAVKPTPARRSVWIFNRGASIPELPGPTRHYDIGREMVARGYDVTVISSGMYYGRTVQNADKGDGWQVVERDGVRFLFVTAVGYERNDWRRVLNWMSFMQRAVAASLKALRLAKLSRPDVIVGSSVDFFAVLGAYRVARKLRVPFVMEIRDLWPQTLIDMGALNPRSPVTRGFQALERFLYRRAKRIIVVPPLAGAYIEALGIPGDRIDWVPNGVDLSRFDAVADEPVPDPSGRLTVMYTGAHGQANGLHVLLEAAAILARRGRTDFHFVLMGEGARKKELVRRAEELGLSSVTFRDPVTKGEVPGILRQADVLFFHLMDTDVFRYGISPNKLFDYLAAGKPILFCASASNSPIEEAQAGFSVPPEDPEAAADALESLAALSAEERERLGRNGRAYVEAYHSSGALAERMIGTVERTLQAAPANV